MIALENASNSLKWVLFKSAANETIISNEKVNTIASTGAIRLFIRSVKGSARPIPPHAPHISPLGCLRDQKPSSFFFMQAAQLKPSGPFWQVPVPEQCLHSYNVETTFIFFLSFNTAICGHGRSWLIQFLFQTQISTCNFPLTGFLNISSFS